MLTLMRSPAPALAPTLLLVSLLLPLGGCMGSSPGDDPAIQHRFQVLADQIRDLKFDVEDSQETIESLSARLESDGPGVAPGALATLEASDQELLQTLEDLQRQVAQLSEELETMHRQQMVSTISAGSALPAPPTASRASADNAVSAAADPAESRASARLASTQPTSSRPRGFYHRLAESEDLESLAERYHTDVATLLQANGMPSNARPLAGQQLFIPQN
ncbi:LysM peptidoglycan-binding domain-containing protein [Candidatus Sumerlaeota bacterium]|nr:LysM peptidoglycan-binding domain-containing protein [Candidatus Sumerlaeota bacterium]